MSRAICLAITAAMAVPAIAHGSPRTDPTAGRAVFTGATLPDATSIDVNPAALGLALSNEVYVAAMAVMDRYAIDRQQIDLDTGALSPSTSVNDLELSPGAMIAGVFPLRDRGALGVSLRTSPAEVFPRGTGLDYFSRGGNQRTYSLGIGGSLRLTNELSFGISLSAESTQLKLQWARDTALEGGRAGLMSDCGGSPCGLENPLATEHYAISVRSDLFSSDSVAANLGLVYELSKMMWVGVGYHTPPGLAVQNQLTGDMSVVRAMRDGGNTVNGGATVYISQPASVDAELRRRMQTEGLDIHVGFRWIDLSRMQAFDVRGYGSVFPSSGIPEWQRRPRGYHDPIALWAGIEQFETEVDQHWRFGGRLGLETSSVDDRHTSPLGIGPTSFTGDVGVQLRLGEVLLQATYGLQYFPTVNVRDSAFDPRARVACIDSGYDYSTAACEAVRLGYGIPTAAGDYSRIEQAGRFAIRYEWE